MSEWVPRSQEEIRRFVAKMRSLAFHCPDRKAKQFYKDIARQWERRIARHVRVEGALFEDT